MDISHREPSGLMVFHFLELVIPFLARDMLGIAIFQISHSCLEIAVPHAEFCYHLGHSTEQIIIYF